MSLDLAEFSEGDILKFKGFPYSHYAVYAGKDQIIHYTSLHGKKSKDSATIVKECIQSYWSRIGKKYPVKATLGFVDQKIVPKTFIGPEVVKRAESKVGRAEYSLVFENCENFVNWCKYDVKMSDEVEGTVVATTTVLMTAGGTVGGAVIGAGLGSWFPVVGTIAGGIIGGAVGFFGGASAGSGGAWATNKAARKVKGKVTSGGQL